MNLVSPLKYGLYQKCFWRCKWISGLWKD